MHNTDSLVSTHKSILEKKCSKGIMISDNKYFTQRKMELKISTEAMNNMPRQEETMYLFQKIDEFTLYGDSRKIIADFLLHQRGKINQYTMQEVAEITHTSKTTLVRFAQMLGYGGWREFLKDFIEEAYHQDRYFSDIDPNVPFTEEDTTQDIVNKISSLQIESILDTADLIDIPTLEHVVDIILSSRYIVLFGLSPNSIIGELFRRKMLAIGINVTVPRVDEGGAFASSLTEKDCAIVISYAGNQEIRRPMKYIPFMERNNVSLIGITGGGDNYIRNHIKCVLTISSHERLYSKIAGFATEISIDTILNLIYACCFKRDYKKNWNYKQTCFSELEVERTATSLEMKENAEFMPE